jgi:hypothetical protein
MPRPPLPGDSEMTSHHGAHRPMTAYKFDPAGKPAGRWALGTLRNAGSSLLVGVHHNAGSFPLAFLPCLLACLLAGLSVVSPQRYPTSKNAICVCRKDAAGSVPRDPARITFTHGTPKGKGCVIGNPRPISPCHGRLLKRQMWEAGSCATDTAAAWPRTHLQDPITESDTFDIRGTAELNTKRYRHCASEQGITSRC